MLIDTQFIYPNLKNVDSDTAVIVLPEIFGLNNAIKGVADRFAEEFNMPAFGLDFFYEVAGEENVEIPYSDHETGVKFMMQLSGENFMALFDKSILIIQDEYPNITNFIVCGFCFGGRLAFLTGLNKNVKKIISFYGAGSTKPDFYIKRSVIEALVEDRKNDNDLKIIGMFGKEDTSIPEEERKQIKDTLINAGIDYTENIFDAGHAFFNSARPDHYNEAAAIKAWETVEDFLG